MSRNVSLPGGAYQTATAARRTLAKTAARERNTAAQKAWNADAKRGIFGPDPELECESDMCELLTPHPEH